jgi:hypothetical protein
MKTLYLECAMGASGDMLMAALLELHPDPVAFIQRLNALGLPNTVAQAAPSMKCGIYGTHITVTIGGLEEHSRDHNVDTDDIPSSQQSTLKRTLKRNAIKEPIKVSTPAHGAHHHSGLRDIQSLINGLDISDAAKNHALKVYDLIGEAESHAHRKPMSDVHFHEVGTLDAVMDIVGVCLLIEDLALDNILASPIHVGSGHVRCSHGILPVPAPATAYILKGVPTYGGTIKGELCTPTGAALLKHFVSEFMPMPVLTVEAIGYGMGTKDFPMANCLRAFIGTSKDSLDQVLELSCNLDDMTPEAIGFAQEMLFEAGALDVFTHAIGMKKNRPATLLTCMCRPEEKETFLKVLFKHTSTLGVRETLSRRYTLTREIHSTQTPYGTVSIKRARGYGVIKEKYEYEDLAKIAKDHGLSLAEVLGVVKEHNE